MDTSTNTAFQTQKAFSETFLNDVLDGLGGSPKRLFSKYFYDQAGDRLFQQIMEMPEYYLTDCELDVFKNKTRDIAAGILCQDGPFDLIEMGAGDAMKSSFLLEYLVKNNVDHTYIPIDISGNILSVLTDKLKDALPQLKVVPLEGEYFEMLDRAVSLSGSRKVVLFLGGNIGNMEMEEAFHFCAALRKRLDKGDILLVGFDLKKNPHAVLKAYSDPAGITAAFNLNLLSRINRELDAGFDIAGFEHYQTYDPVSGACRSYLVSLCEQTVTICGKIINFEQSELIDMEISQKFSQQDIGRMAADSGFRILGEINDSKNWFTDSIWQAV
ncbi:L-histidine N(alpha)-methyltransferase [Flavobacterium qiangtangense]|uniref:L-histidine N(Alpha)-methyltransferase n=1 Tax=Flavobacterium qiangtangense TaxID=1442595 RepID=A0ABW1PIW7_9FLAO